MSDGSTHPRDDRPDPSVADHPEEPAISLNTAVRRRRADHAFYLRLASTIQHHERALARLR
jgi:hypothetical protein